LVELLGARTGLVRKAAAVALEKTGDAGVAAALAGLAHPTPRIRRGAADCTDHHADDRCGPQPVELALRDPVPAVRGPRRTR
jgi:HEAT repeat protein